MITNAHQIPGEKICVSKNKSKINKFHYGKKCNVKKS